MTASSESATEFRDYNSIKIFICYADEDKKLRDQLRLSLAALQKNRTITMWDKEDIVAGGNVEITIKQHLDPSKIILLLISPDFIANHDAEIKMALAKKDLGEAQVIPIRLRPMYIVNHPLNSLQWLPGDWVTTLPNQDVAFEEIAQGISQVCNNLNRGIDSSSNSSAVSNQPIERDVSPINLFNIVILNCPPEESDRDEGLREIGNQLDALQLEGLRYYSRKKAPLNKEVEFLTEKIKSAQLILILVSVDFLAAFNSGDPSDSQNVIKALELTLKDSESKEKIIPISYSTDNFKGCTLFNEYCMKLPSNSTIIDGKFAPNKQWDEVRTGISRHIEQLRSDNL